MQVEKIIPPVNYFLKVNLDKVIIDYLWEIIEIGKTSNIDVKKNLAGNISQSYLLDDRDSYINNGCPNCSYIQHLVQSLRLLKLANNMRNSIRQKH